MSGAQSVAEPIKIMIVNSWGNDVVFLDLKTLTETSRFPVFPNPHEIRHDPRRDLVYVSMPYKDGFYDRHDEDGHHLAVVDPRAERLVEIVDLAPEVGPHGMFVDEANDLLWLTVETDGGAVLALDLATRKVVTRIPCGVTDGKPHWMTMSADGRTVYTANKESRSVSVLDAERGVVKALLAVPGGSEDVELNADGSRLFVSSREDRVLHVFDTASLEEVGRIEVNERPGRLVLTADGKLVVSHFNVRLPNGTFLQGLLTIVDPVELRVRHWVHVGRAPMDLTTSADGRLAYVTHGHSGTLFELDLETINIKRVVEVGVSPHGVLLL